MLRSFKKRFRILIYHDYCFKADCLATPRNSEISFLYLRKQLTTPFPATCTNFLLDHFSLTTIERLKNRVCSFVIVSREILFVLVSVWQRLRNTEKTLLAINLNHTCKKIIFEQKTRDFSHHHTLFVQGGAPIHCRLIFYAWLLSLMAIICTQWNTFKVKHKSWMSDHYTIVVFPCWSS